MPEIETKRLRLRMPSPDDIDDLATIFGDAEVMRFLGVEAGTTLSRAETQLAVEKMIEFWERNGVGRWTVIEKMSGKIIGLCGLRLFEDTPELFYLFARNSWGKGFATEAALATLEFTFEDRGATRIIAVLRPGNLKSINVLKKLGLKFEQEVKHFGVDGVLYVATPEDFRARDTTRGAQQSGEMSEAEIDRNLADTFPASDPPSWTLGTEHVAPSTTNDDKSE